MKIEAPFYVPFMYIDCEFFEDIKDELIDIIMKIHNKDPYAIQGTLPKGKSIKQNLTESDENFLEIENDCINKLRGWFTSSLLQGYKSLKINKGLIKYKSSWFHVAKKGGFHNLHYHGDAPLAGIFYVQSGNSDTGNLWVNPIPGYIDEISSNWCKPTYNSKFVPGRLVLFPGWLLHAARPHDGGDLRIVIAFNSIAE